MGCAGTCQACSWPKYLLGKKAGAIPKVKRSKFSKAIHSSKFKRYVSGKLSVDGPAPGPCDSAPYPPQLCPGPAGSRAAFPAGPTPQPSCESVPMRPVVPTLDGEGTPKML